MLLRSRAGLGGLGAAAQVDQLGGLVEGAAETLGRDRLDEVVDHVEVEAFVGVFLVGGDEDDQGQLDELEPKIVTCPNCKTEFDCREQV